MKILENIMIYWNYTLFQKNNPDWVCKILDKDEFHPILNTDLDLIMFLSKYDNNRLNLYRKILVKLRNVIHKIYIENIN